MLTEKIKIGTLGGAATFAGEATSSMRERYPEFSEAVYFPSMDALKKGVATPAFKGVADDLPKFATGGFDALVAVETK